MTAAPVRSFMCGKSEAHHSHRLNQVRFLRATPVLVDAVGDARPAAATVDIVDQNVDAAIGRDGGLDQRPASGHRQLQFAAEQGVNSHAEHHRAAERVYGSVLGHHQLTQQGRTQNERQNDCSHARRKEEGHRDQNPAVLKRARKIRRQHHRDAARCKERYAARNKSGNHRAAREDAAFHSTCSGIDGVPVGRRRTPMRTRAPD
jgi:hypothetical protein